MSTESERTEENNVSTECARGKIKCVQNQSEQGEIK